MQDLNDIRYFVRVVERRAFSAASKELGIAKSQLSFRIARLEENLGVRLIHRTTRRFHITDIGRLFYEQCLQILEAVEQARRIVDDVHTKPGGRLHIGCPVSLDKLVLSPVLMAYLKQNPLVRVDLDVCHHQTDVIEAGYDIAFRVLPSIENSSMVVRSFGLDPQILVASPDLIRNFGNPGVPEDLRQFPSVAAVVSEGRHFWSLRKSNDDAQVDAGTVQVEHYPSLVSDDLQILLQAILGGIGVAECPEFMCRPYLAKGQLVRLLPDWKLPPRNVHAVYPSRLGHTPVLRDFIGYIVQHVPGALEKLQQSFNGFFMPA